MDDLTYPHVTVSCLGCHGSCRHDLPYGTLGELEAREDGVVVS